MLRSHWTGFLLPIFLGIVVMCVALMATGLPLAILLSMFGSDPFSTIVFVLINDRATLAGVTGSLGVIVGMWIGHLVSRTQNWISWFGWGVAGYAIGALAIWTLVPQTLPPT